MISRGGTVTGKTWYAAQYIRQSRKKANKSEASPEDQRAETGAWISAQPDCVLVGAGRYEDIGVSGYDPNAERKGFERLLADCRAGRVNMIVVHYGSRFSRQNYNVVLMQMLELFTLGVRVISVNEGEFKNENIMDLMNIVMRFEQGHNESRNKSIAVRGTFQRAREAGGWVGGHPPYGFQVIKSLSGKIAIQTLWPQDTIPATGPQISERDVVRLMWSTIKAGMNADIQRGQRNPASLAGLMLMLNERGIPTRGATKGGVHKDALWSVSTINRCLRDPRLAGYKAERINRHGHQYRILRDADGKPLTGGYEPIIEPHEWWELQAWLDKRGLGRGNYRHTSLLSALRNAEDKPMLKCGCGASLTSYTPSAKSTAKAFSYRCNKRDVEAHTGTNTMVQHHLDDYVAARIFALISTADGDPESLDVLTEATRRFALKIQPVGNVQERTRLVTERAEAAAALREAEGDYREVASKGPATRRAVLEELDRAEQRLAELDSALAALESADTVRLPIEHWLAAPDGDPLGEGSWWASASLADKREFVALFIDRIEIKKTSLRGNRWKTYDARERVTLTWAGDLRHSKIAA
jgi:DNA invertase Pin-like site-specific DNA recombinase